MLNKKEIANIILYYIFYLLVYIMLKEESVVIHVENND
jgi:hypothetical protein